MWPAEEIAVSFCDCGVHLSFAGKRCVLSYAAHESWVLAGASATALAMELTAPCCGPVFPLVFGEYILLRQIGRGSFGDVFEAWDPVCGERVAVKVLHQVDAWSLQGFKNEFRRLAELDHPGLVAPEELVTAGGREALVMRLIAGPGLLEALRLAAGTSGPLADEAALRGLTIDLLSALATLHRGGLVHMDLKPGNVRVDGDGRPQILDFGLSRLREARAETHVAGSPPYMAPEQLMRRSPTPAFDLYALGVLLFEGIAGVHPFAGADDPVFARLYEPAPSIRRLRPELPERWASIVDGLLEHAPEARPGIDAILRRLDAPPPPRVAVPQLVGRDDELRALRRAWERVGASVPTVTMVAGVAGVGKSELLRVFTEELAASGAASVVWGRCYDSDSLPFKIVDALVDGLVEFVLADPARLAAARELPGLRGLATIAPAIAALFEGEEPAADAELAAQGGRGESLARLVGLLAERRPVVLVVDDAQWGDADSVDLLAPLLTVPGLRPVMIVFIHRTTQWASSAFGRALEAKIDKGIPCDVHRLDLGPLRPEHARRLVVARAPGPLAEAQLRWIVELAAGSPYLLDVYIRLLSEEREVSGGEDLVERRLADLSGEERRFVDAVAIAGAPTELIPAIAAAGVRAPGRRLLARLRVERVLAFDRGGGRRRVMIAHDLIRIAILERVHPAVQRDVHARLGDALIAEGGRDAGRIGRHLLAAGRREEGRRYALAGASEAEDARAYARAAELLGLVLETSADDDRERVRLRERRADLLIAGGRGHEAAELLLTLAGEAVGERARALRRRAVEALMIVGEVERGLEVLAPLLRELRLPPVRRGLGGLLQLSGQGARLLLRCRGAALSPRADALAAERADACWVGAKGLIFIETGLATSLLVQALFFGAASGSRRRFGRVMGVIAGFFPSVPGLRRVTKIWLERLREWGDEDPYLRASETLWRGFRALADGEYVAAREHGERARELLGGVSEASWERVQAASALARTLRGQGEFASQSELCRKQVREAERRGDLYGQVLFSDYGLLALIAAGGVDEARQRLRWISERWLPERFTVTDFYCVVFACYADLAEGDAQAAASRLIEARWRIRKSGAYMLSISRVDVTILEGRIVASLGDDAPRGLTSLAKIIAALGREETPDARGNAALLAASAAARRRDHAAAEAALDEAFAVFAGAGIAMEGAATRLRRAELRGDDDVARAMLAELRRLGAWSPAGWAAVIAPGFVAADEPEGVFASG
ncbi:MAG: AAA family ATPase [Nannocystaceae bacterium]